MSHQVQLRCGFSVKYSDGRLRIPPVSGVCCPEDQKEMSEVPGRTLESGAGLRLAPKSICFQVQNQIAITSELENGEDSLSSSAENGYLMGKHS